MQASQVIKFFLELHKYRLTMYRIAKMAEIRSNAVSRIVDGTHKDVSQSMLINIANGLGKINPYFKPVFWTLIGTDPVEDDVISTAYNFYSHEEPEVISLILEELFEMGLLTTEMIEEKSKHPKSAIKALGLAEYISLRLQQKRLRQRSRH